MIRTVLFAAAAATLVAVTVPGSARAAMANPGLGAAAPSAAEPAQYYYGGRPGGYERRNHHRRYYGHRPYRAYGYYPGYRRCVTVWNGWRYVRRCRW